MIAKKIVNRLKMLLNDRRWWGFYFQRQFLQPARRARLAAMIASKWRPAAQFAPFDKQRQMDSETLSLSGIVTLGELISPEACEELLLYFAACQVHDPYRLERQHFMPGDDAMRHPDAHIAHHDARDVLAAPHLMALANSPRILGIVSEYLGCKPTIGYLAAWWSFPTGKVAQQAESFHRDVDDWKFIKLFVYLTNVGPDSGPHVYVQNSSRSDRLIEIRRFTDDEVVAAFGNNNVLTMTATAGKGFLEDTFGVHKGQPVVAGTRLIFQAVYGLSPLPYGPKAPVMSRIELGQDHLDPWINRVYLK